MDTKDEKVKKRPKIEPKGETKDKRIRVEPIPSSASATTPTPKAKARARSDSGRVRAEVARLNDIIDRGYWKDQSANEIKNQLRLRKVPQDDWMLKDKGQLVGIIVKVIKASLSKK